MQTFLDYGEVELIRHDHDDLTVVNAARVSNAKRSHYETKAYPGGQTVNASTRFELAERDIKLISYLADHHHWTPFAHCRYTYDVMVNDWELGQLLEWSTSQKGAGFVITRLRPAGQEQRVMRMTGSLWGWLVNTPPVAMEEKIKVYRHLIAQCPWSAAKLLTPEAFQTAQSYKDLLPSARPLLNDPLTDEHKSVTLRIKAPIFVFRQLMRSNEGIVYNETSRRYVDHPPQYHFPHRWRARPDKSVKQGSGEDAVLSVFMGRTSGGSSYKPPDVMYKRAVVQADNTYLDFVGGNIAPELARMVLPQSMYSELWMTATLPAIQRVQGLRLGRDEHNHPQQEIVQLAEAIEHELAI